MPNRRERLSRQIQKDLAVILDRFTSEHLSGSLITITDSEVTPDLGLAKIYISIIGPMPKDKVMELLELHNKDLRYLMAAQLKNQLRRIPEVKFYLDETLEKALKMDELIRNLHIDETKE